ncbi:MAG: DUF4013 domain-containing protein [Anaerolineae bacterium]
MDIGKAFTYMFDDENWLMKILIGGFIALVPILNFAIGGYMVETIRNVIQDYPRPLPEWGDNFGGKFTKGLKLVVIGLVYSLPLILVLCCAFIVLALLGEGEGEGLADVASLAMTAVYCVFILYGLLLGLIFPAILIRFAVTDELMSAFRFGEVFGLVIGNLGNYIISLLLWLVASWLAGFGVVACFIGVLFTGFWANLVGANLFGQVYKQSIAQPV